MEGENKMKIGKKIQDLRKKERLSQEQLASKIGVTRQTISNWELEESTPDLKQAIQLTKVFNISLDELVDNDLKDVLVERVSNTERLAGLIITILKVTGIVSFLLLVIIASIIFFANYFKTEPTAQGIEMKCTIDGKDNWYTVYTDMNDNITSVYSDGELDKELSRELTIPLETFSTPEEVLNYIEDFIKSKGGTCR